VARNRKRAKDRRARRPQPVVSGRPVRDPEGLASAGEAERDPKGPAESAGAAERDPEGLAESAGEGLPQRERRPEAPPAPDPIGQAAPDAGLAEAQLALGRPEDEDGDELEPADGDGGEGNRGGAGFGGREGGGEPPETPGGELAVPAAPLPAGPLRAGHRLVTFIQGSWRELQRVQWPDRRQVMQATGVVIGFVIVAGAFLGVADAVAAKLVNLILK
jgi:preprotein translocase SecE subunit